MSTQALFTETKINRNNKKIQGLYKTLFLIMTLLLLLPVLIILGTLIVKGGSMISIDFLFTDIEGRYG